MLTNDQLLFVEQAHKRIFQYRRNLYYAAQAIADNDSAIENLEEVGTEFGVEHLLYPMRLTWYIFAGENPLHIESTRNVYDCSFMYGDTWDEQNPEHHILRHKGEGIPFLKLTAGCHGKDHKLGFLVRFGSIQKGPNDVCITLLSDACRNTYDRLLYCWRAGFPDGQRTR
jgi:hypothetical protein